MLPPAACPGRLRDGGQGPPLLLTDAVLGEQVPQVSDADAGLPRLDPADLGTVAFQDAGGIVQSVAPAFAVPAQGAPSSRRRTGGGSVTMPSSPPKPARRPDS